MMIPFRKYVLLINLILLSWLMPPFSLAQTEVTVEVNEPEVTLGQQVTLTVTVIGDSSLVTLPDLPVMPDFVEVGRSTSQQVRIVNGNMTAEHLFVYQLLPQRTGHLTIDPITISLYSGDVTTDPVMITVLPALTSSPDDQSAESQHIPLDSSYFVEAEVDKNDPFFGEQVIYTFRLYRISRYYNDPKYEDPTFTDFWNQTIIDQPSYRTKINGQSYFVDEVRTAIFPATLGLVTISPARLVIPGLLQPDETYETEALTVTVRSLPPDAPASFKGAVGQYTIRSYLNQPTGQIDEPLSWFIEIEGFGNIEVLNEPDLPELPDWRMFDSQAQTTIKPRDEGVYGVRRFERMMIPTQSGQYTIPAVVFTYFDPQTESYHTLETEPLPFSIEASGQQPHASAMPNAPDLSELLNPLKPVPLSLEPDSVNLFTQPLYWFCWFLPMLIVGLGGGAKWFYQQRRHRQQTPIKRAYRQAMQLLQPPIAGEAHQVAQQALTLYLAEKFARTSHTLSKDTLVTAWPSAPNDIVERYQDIINRIEISRYAPGGVSYGQSLISDTQQFIQDLEQRHP